MNWRFDWIDGSKAEIPFELQRRWDDAFESHGNIWQCREFFRCWDETMAAARNQRPVLLVGSDGAGHQVIYPLYAQRRIVRGLPFTIVEPMGGASFCDYQDPLSIGDPMRDGEWQSFWTGFRQSLPRRLGRLSELQVHRLTALSGAGGKDLQVSSVSPYIPLDKVSDLWSLLEGRGRKLRQRVRRSLQQLEDRGGYSLRRVSPDSIHEAMTQFCISYERQWGREDQPHVLQRPETSFYWEALATTAARLNKLHFTVFEVDGEPWHWHWGFEHRGVLLWYKLTYDRRFSQFSPGTLHLALLVEDAIARGMSCLDLGCGAEDYKFRWTDHDQQLFGGRSGSLLPLTRFAKRAMGWGRALKFHLSTFRSNNGRTSVEP